MIANISNFLTNMDKNSRFLLIVIGIISFLLVLIFIINYVSEKKAKKIAKIKYNYKKRLEEEIEKESKNIDSSLKTISTPKKEEIEEEIEVLEEDFEEIKEEPKVESLIPNFDLTDFEREQEETAIISYDELCKRAGVQKKVYTSENTDIMNKVDQMIEPKKEERHFKPTTYVSPIFGADK